MPKEATIFECYGHGIEGDALVLADSRETALQYCREWLGWQIAVAFRAPDRRTQFENSGGDADHPIIFSPDQVHYTALDSPIVEAPHA